MATHSLDPSPATRHGWYSREFEPVLTVDPGDTVRLSTLDCWWSAGPYAGEPVPEWPREEGYEPGAGHAAMIHPCVDVAGLLADAALWPSRRTL